MRVRRLRTYDLPDVGDHLIHFTGRTGRKLDVDPETETRPADDRLLSILLAGTIRGFATFGSDRAPVVCLSESTTAAVPQLIREGRYEPCGVGFSKQLVFERNGGPALYVRGDEWDTVSALPHPVRSRLVRFWPGADPDSDEHLPSSLAERSEWLHEREWRVPTEFRFEWSDVKFLIVPYAGWQAQHADWIQEWGGEQHATAFMNIPALVMDWKGNVLSDDSGIWKSRLPGASA